MDEIEAFLFNDLPEPLRRAIFQAAWRDSGSWRDPASRKRLRLVCRQACAAVDAAIESISVGVLFQHGDAGAVPACIHAVGSGRFPALRDWSIEALFLAAKQAEGLIAALTKALSRPLRKLCLRGDCFGKPAAVAAVAGTTAMPALRAVTFKDTFIDAAGCRMLAHGFGPCLDVLKLPTNSLASAGVATLAQVAAARLPALRELDLSENGLRDAGVRALAQVAWGALEVLNLNDNYIKRNGMAALADAAAQLPALRHLSLAMNNLGDDGVEALVRCSWPRLEYLELGRNEIGAGGAAALAAASAATRLPALRELWLLENIVDDAGAQALAEGTWSALEALQLQENMITHAGAAALSGASSARLPALRRLNIGFNQFLRDAGVEALVRCPWPRLQELQLALIGINAAGAASLGAAQADCVPALETLVLKGNNLGTSGILALLQPTPWANLQCLDLANTSLDAESMAALAAASGSQLPALRKLEVGGFDLCGAGIAALADGQWPHLEALNLDAYSPHLNIEDIVDGFMALAAGAPRFPALCSLRLPGLEVSEEQLAVMRAAWPGDRCMIINR